MALKNVRHPNALTFPPTGIYDPVKRHKYCITYLIIMLYRTFMKEWPLSHNYIMIVCRPGVSRQAIKISIQNETFLTFLM